MFKDDSNGFIGQDCRIRTFKFKPQGLFLRSHHFTFFDLQGRGYNVTYNEYTLGRHWFFCKAFLYTGQNPGWKMIFNIWIKIQKVSSSKQKMLFICEKIHNPSNNGYQTVPKKLYGSVESPWVQQVPSPYPGRTLVLPHCR